MKTLINKANPAIRITTPKIIEEDLYYTLDGENVYLKKNWTLVEEEPEKLHIDKPRGYNLVSEDATANGFNQSKEPVDLEQAADKKVLSEFVKKINSQEETPESIKKVIAEHYWDMLGEDNASTELEQAAEKYSINTISIPANDVEKAHEAIALRLLLEECFKAGAEWQKKQKPMGLEKEKIALDKLSEDDLPSNLEDAAQCYYEDRMGEKMTEKVETDDIPRAFEAGAEWAIEKAAEWLLDNICNYDVCIDEVEFTDDFKEFMEGKK